MKSSDAGILPPFGPDLPTTPTSTGVSRWCSFSRLLMTVSIVTVGLGCFIVWWLGYRSGELILDDLSTRLRDSIGTRLRDTITVQLNAPLNAAGEMLYLSRRTLVNISQSYEFTNRDGFLADLTEQMVRYPSVQQMIVVGANYRFWFLGQRLAGAKPHEIIYTFSDMRITQQEIANPQPNTLNNTYQPPDDTFPGSVFMHQYVPYETVANFTQEATSIDWTLTNPTASPEEVIAALGPRVATAWFPFPGQSPFTSQPFFTRALELNGTLGWTNLELTGEALNLGATQIAKNPDGSLAFVVLGVTTIDYLDSALSDLWNRSIPSGEGGVFIVLTDGRLLGSSLVGVPELRGVQLTNTTHPLLAAIGAILSESGLLNPTTPQPVLDQTLGNQPIPPSVTVSQSLRVDGVNYHLHAITGNERGLNWINTLLTPDSEFTGPVAATIRDTAIVSGAVLIGAVIMSVGLGFFLVTRPLTRLTQFITEVTDASRQHYINYTAHAMNQPTHDFNSIWQRWKQGIEGVGLVPPTRTDDIHLKDPSSPTDALLMAGSPVVSSPPPPLSSPPVLSCHRSRRCTAISLPVELESLQSGFTTMLWSLKQSSDRVEKATQAKRHFIRYIFHEIRVPFNAVVLGIDHLQAMASRFVGMPGGRSFNEVVHLLSEQSDVVRRILNDVLSLQKIEEGGLTLESTPFAIDRMIQSTFQSFITTAQDKQITFRIELDSLDEFVLSHFPDWTAARVELAGSEVGPSGVQSTSVQSHSSSSSSSAPSSTTNLATLAEGVGGTSAVELTERPTSEPGHASRMRVIGDQFRLRQCLANFISNSLKFTPMGGTVLVRLKISPIPPHWKANMRSSSPMSLSSATMQSETNKRMAMFHISVVDNGCGLSVAEQSQLWVPYLQIRAGEKQQGGGTGLGLTNAKLLVELHGGVIGSVSPPTVPGFDAGSDFYFDLPLEIVLPPPPSDVPIHTHSTHSTPSQLMREIPSLASNAATPLASTHQLPAHIRTQSQSDDVPISSTTSSGPVSGVAIPPSDSEMVTVRFHDDPHTSDQTMEMKSYDGNGKDTESYGSPAIVTPQFTVSGSPSHTPPIDSLTHTSSTNLLVPSNPVSSPPQLRCLVVDDSSATRKLLVMLLRSMGCRVEAVENGLMCVNIFMRWKDEQEQRSDDQPGMTKPATTTGIGSSAPGTFPTSTVDSSIDVGVSSSSSSPPSRLSWNIPPASASTAPFDIVFMDSVMPVLSGLEACRILRSKGFTLPIIGATGNALEEDIETFKQAGATDVITKPITRADLIRVVERVRGQHKQIR